MAKDKVESATVVEPATSEVRELGDSWDGMPVQTEETEVGYDEQQRQQENLADPKYDFDAEDDHDDPGDKPEPEAKEEAPEEPQALSRDDWADYGLTEEQAKNLDAKGELGSVLDLMDRRFLAAGKGEKKDEQAEEVKRPAITGPVKLDLDPDIYDEGLVNQLSAIVDYANTLHQQVEQLVSGTRQERMDAFFATLGDEQQQVFGKGSLDDLPSSSPARQKRLEVIATADALRAGYEKLGQPIPGERVLLTRAMRMVAGDELQSAATKKAVEQSRNARGQFIAKPTHREGKPLSRSERAAEFAEQFYKRKGL